MNVMKADKLTPRWRSLFVVTEHEVPIAYFETKRGAERFVRLVEIQHSKEIVSTYTVR